MRRVAGEPRPFPVNDPGPRAWDASACYELDRPEIAMLMEAAQALDRRCRHAVEHLMTSARWADFGVPPGFISWVRRSWTQDGPALIARLDLRYDGREPPRLCGYDADTPAGLLEAAVVQRSWLQDTSPGAEQCNTISERLFEAFRGRAAGRDPMTFLFEAGDTPGGAAAHYLCERAGRAGLSAQPLTLDQVGWNAARRRFTDARGRPLDRVFKWLPWEVLLQGPFGPFLLEAPTRWLEPPWTALVRSPAFLPVLGELFPGQIDVSWPPADAVVLSCWLVNGSPCGLGVHEDDAANGSRFVPHRIA